MKKLLFLIFLLIECSVVIAEDIVVMSYNILSPRYLKCGNYHNLPEDIINLTSRTDKVIDIIYNKNPDIITLQEVEESALQILTNKLSNLYFTANSKSSDKDKDFIATFYKKNKFKRIETRVVEYPNSTKDYLAIKLIMANGNQFWLINTKIKWDKESLPLASHTGFKQINYLTQEIIDKYQEPVIVCGDFNVVPESEYVKPLLSLLRDPYKDKNYNTVNINLNLRRIDYILHSKGLSSLAISSDLIDLETKLPSLDNPSDHMPILASIELSNVS